MLNRRPNKRRALNAVPVNSMVMLVWLPVNRARKTRITATKEETALALIVLRDGRPPLAVPNAKRAVQDNLVMLLVKTVKIAEQVNTVQVNTKMVLVLIQLLASLVLLDLDKVMKDRRLASHAFPVNSTMFPVRLRANVAKRILFQATKIEPCPATNAPPERHQPKEVSNATESHVKRAPIKISLMANAKNAHKAGNQKN